MDGYRKIYENAMVDLFILLVLSLISVNLWRNIIYFKKQKVKRLPKKYPFLSVLIPCRNEEENVENCIKSLLSQDYPKFEIIALDDSSNDRTYEILLRLCKENPSKIKVLKGKPLPSGWTGKNWACHQLSEEARGEWFVFVDADTKHSPSFLKTAYSIAKENRALFISAIPELDMRTMAEKIILPVIHFAFYLLFPFHLLNKLSSSKLSLAIGPFIMVKKEVYQKVGGHKAIKKEIVDDIELARNVKRIGERMVIMEGKNRIKVRFYKNLAEIWNGFSKNSFGAFGYSALSYILFLTFGYLVFLHPFVRFYLNPWISLKNPVFLEVIFIILLRSLVVLRVGEGMLSIILHPFMILFSLLFAFNSLLKVIFKRSIVWKERAYKI